MGSVVPAFAYSKEETVYTKLKTNGTEKTTVVSQHLINDQKETMLEDQTTLTNVKNIQTKTLTEKPLLGKQVMDKIFITKGKRKHHYQSQ